MKITKIEQPQTGFVAGSGARPLSARLNAGAMAAPGQAVAQLGNTISNIGQQWLEKEVAIRNQAEVSKAKSHMSSAVETAREMVKAIPDPLEAERVFNRYVNSERQRVDKGGVEGLSFTTGSGKRTWRAETSAIIANGAKNVRTTARALMAETAVTNSYRNLDEIAVKMSTAPTTSDRDRLEREVRLEAMNLREMGYIGPKDEFNLVKKYLGKADVLQVEAQLLQAEKNDDPEAAENVFSAIQSPESYPNLELEDRQNLSERSLRLANRLESKALATDDRKQRKAKTQLEERQNKKYRTYAAQIQKYRLDSEKNERPSLLDIETDFATGEISDKHRTTLERMLQSSDDPIIVDNKELNDFFKEIRAANSESDLNAIVDRAYSKVGLTQTLDTVQRIENRARSQIARTPQAQQERIFGSVLDQVVQSGGILDSILPGAKEKAAIIRAQFEADIDDGVAVPQAFRNAVDALQRGQTTNLRSLVAPRLGAAKEKPLAQWTVEDVKESRTETKRAFQGKASSLALELFKLRILENYITTKTQVDKDTADELNKLNPGK